VQQRHLGKRISEIYGVPKVGAGAGETSGAGGAEECRKPKGLYEEEHTFFPDIRFSHEVTASAFGKLKGEARPRTSISVVVGQIRHAPSMNGGVLIGGPAQIPIGASAS